MSATTSFKQMPSTPATERAAWWLGWLLALALWPALTRAELWAPDSGFVASADAVVYTQALQPDGKVLVGGAFTTVNGTVRNAIARLNADGSLDTSFDPGTGANGAVYHLVRQPDGKVLIGGQFSTVNGTTRNNVARLNVDGSLDDSFTPGTGPNDLVNHVALLPDGKVLMGGNFTLVNGSAHLYIARLNADGSLDASYGTSADGWVVSMAVQPDGKVFVAGLFDAVNGTPRRGVARLNADGSLDTGFDPGTGMGPASSWGVFVSAAQPDGKVLIGGQFSTVNGTTRNNVARLNVDGSLDDSFTPGIGTNEHVRALALHPDGTVIVGGPFTTVDGLPVGNLSRLRADGSRDLSFDVGSGPNNTVWAVNLQPDGKWLIAGSFTVINGDVYTRLARLALRQSINFAAQIPASQTLPVGGNFAVSPLATADSGLPITYSSLTPAVCTVSGTAVTVVASGTCMVAADQPGEAGWAAAAQVTQAVSLVALPPNGGGTALAVPTLGQWGVLLLGLMAAGLGALHMRQRS